MKSIEEKSANMLNNMLAKLECKNDIQQILRLTTNCSEEIFSMTQNDQHVWFNECSLKILMMS
jgi:DNA-directed RNA polymerase subunit RPC12/RpoP